MRVETIREEHEGESELSTILAAKPHRAFRPSAGSSPPIKRRETSPSGLGSHSRNPRAQEEEVAEEAQEFSLHLEKALLQGMQEQAEEQEEEEKMTELINESARAARVKGDARGVVFDMEGYLEQAKGELR